METSSEKAGETGKLGPSETISPGRRLVPSLVFIVLILSLSGPILASLQGEIALTFFGVDNQATRGYVMQLDTVVNAANVAAALATSALVIRFRHKALYLIGLGLLALGSVGVVLAPDFLSMLVFRGIGGFGAPMVGIMAMTLLGDFLTQSRKAKAVGYFFAAAWVGVIVGTVALYFLARGNFFDAPGAWRLAFLLFDLPFAVVALVVAFFGISSKLHNPQVSPKKEIFIRSYKMVFLNKSAAACLIGSLLFVGGIAFLVMNYFQKVFELSRPDTFLFIISNASMFAASNFVAGRLANRIGAKKLTVIGAVGDGIFITLMFFAPNIWIGFVCNWLHIWFGTTGATALIVLALDQVPMARGTMMSFRSMFGNIGNTIAPAIGGGMLALFQQASVDFPALGFQVAGIVLGAMGIASAIIIFFMVKDTTRTLLQEEKKAEIR